MKKSLSLVLLFLVHLIGAQERGPKILNLEVWGAWDYLESIQMTDNGEWFAYLVKPGQGDASLTLDHKKSVKTERIQLLPEDGSTTAKIRDAWVSALQNGILVYNALTNKYEIVINKTGACQNLVWDTIGEELVFLLDTAIIENLEPDFGVFRWTNKDITVSPILKNEDEIFNKNNLMISDNEASIFESGMNLYTGITPCKEKRETIITDDEIGNKGVWSYQQAFLHIIQESRFNPLLNELTETDNHE